MRGCRGLSNLASFVWSIADQLRGPFKPNEYGDVILPMTVLRRLDCVLAQDRQLVWDFAEQDMSEEMFAATVRRRTNRSFWNTSRWNFARLVSDPDGLETNLNDFLAGFSANIDVFERFDFPKTIHRMAEKDRLLLVVQKFADIDLHPVRVSNAEMGDLYEELIRKFAEASNETAGEHFTPRDAIRLMVDLLFAREDLGLQESGTVRSIYDPTAGTGGMLSVAEEYLIGTPENPGLNPDARLKLVGQEINDQSYAICKSDLIGKGQDPSNIKLGDTLADDQFPHTTFDFGMSNPPYGVDWKASSEKVRIEVAALGDRSRFPGGLPPISDGQMLFLQHLVSKLRPVHQGGGRAAIVLNGSPLFTGGAESGPSNIRRWLLEHDLVDAIVALPTNMFYNTGIATYVWVLDNHKPADRIGTVQLIDGSGFFTKMRKNLGSKNRELSADDRKRILDLYTDHADGDHSKVLPVEEFGYWTITVERPLLDDDDGEIVRDRQGRPKPDTKRRDTENVPFTYAGNDRGDDGRDTTIVAYLQTEVLPHVPDAWLDHAKTKVGYEIPFTRQFYVYQPPRPLEEIDAELNELVGEILELLREVEQ